MHFNYSTNWHVNFPLWASRKWIIYCILSELFGAKETWATISCYRCDASQAPKRNLTKTAHFKVELSNISTKYTPNSIRISLNVWNLLYQFPYHKTSSHAPEWCCFVWYLFLCMYVVAMLINSFRMYVWYCYFFFLFIYFDFELQLQTFSFVYLVFHVQIVRMWWYFCLAILFSIS